LLFLADSSPSLSEKPAIVWFRDDLRVDDNPALREAALRDASILALFVLDETQHRPLGGASRWWLHHSLKALANDLKRHGIKLCVRSGDAGKIVPALVDAIGAKAVFWNRRYTASGIAQDSNLKSALKDRGLEVRSFSANLLHEPWTIETNAGGPYRVFTPFSRAARESGLPDAPKSAPKDLERLEWRCGEP
jgi:deoxyribodipyrimidine photo-lyase